ncbi:MAG: AMP-binding protein [Candidatus Latescibacteria bacterium]|nr:AMP-binding protein [Candidatus Latescibacterota bacterium]
MQSIINYLENTSNDIILNVLPLSFDYGLYQVIMSVMFGGTVILKNNIIFMHNIIKSVEKETVTGFPVVPTIVAMLRSMHNLDKYNINSLRYVTNTGADLPEILYE